MDDDEVTYRNSLNTKNAVYILILLLSGSYCCDPERRAMLATYIDQSKVVFIDWKLLGPNVFFQGRGIGALRRKGKASYWQIKRGG